MQTQQPPSRDPLKPSPEPKEHTPDRPDKGRDKDKSRPLPGANS
jgi:hypothetical protein